MSGINEPFQKYIGEKTALYGLGTETKGALLSLEDRFEILGLLDSFREEGELYGKKIVSLSYVVEAGVKLIIVVARPGSCKAIAGKIGDICSECGIALMDIRGKNLLERESITYSFMHMKGETKDELYKKIDKAEVISFDLFDTLILREVLFSSDIIELMDSALKMKDIYIDQFPSKRLEAEKRLSDEGAPTLERLYKEVLKCTQGVCVSAGELAELEWEIDCRTLLRREAVCEAYKYCIQKKKAVYIVTDTYYTKTQIEQILRECLLTGYTGLLVSCEYNTGKRQHLFDKLLELEGEKQYLHIGDDLITDMEMALKKGMDTYRIFSKEDLLDAVGNMGLEMDSDSLAERLKVGMFSAKLFNDPFQFETAKKKIEDRLLPFSKLFRSISRGTAVPLLTALPASRSPRCFPYQIPASSRQSLPDGSPGPASPSGSWNPLPPAKSGRFRLPYPSPHSTGLNSPARSASPGSLPPISWHWRFPWPWKSSCRPFPQPTDVCKREPH